MKPIRTSFMVILVLAAGYAEAQARIPLKEAKLNIQHNATDRDTGLQGFIDSEGWRRLAMRGPRGSVLTFRGRGAGGGRRRRRAPRRPKRPRQPVPHPRLPAPHGKGPPPPPPHDRHVRA